MNREEQVNRILGAAKHDGDRIVFVNAEGDKKTAYAGLGNRSGLHSYIPEAISKLWAKSGKNLTRKVNELPAGAKVEVHTFQNINRDRGRWVVLKSFVMKEGLIPRLDWDKVIPENIRKVYDEYGFDPTVKPEAIAWRAAFEWFGILFQAKDGELWAVDFVQRYNGKELIWEVSNDYVGPFASVEEFRTDELTRTFL